MGFEAVLSRISYLDRQFDSISDSLSAVQSRSERLSNMDIFQQELQNMIEKKQQSQQFCAEKPEVIEGFSHVESKEQTSKAISREQIDSLIEKYSEKMAIDSNFVKAVVKQESGYNPKALSKCGAKGLMQLMPGTASALGVSDPYDASQNIEGGIRYLKGLLQRFNGDMELALAAYNAGPNAVKKYGTVPPYPETQNYVKSVMSMYRKNQSEGDS